MRTLVQIFTSRAELLDKDETTAEHGQNQREEAEKLEADKSNENPRNGGLFQGFFKPKLHPSGPIIDAEDGVARCPHCAWELEEDSCLNCGYHVDDDSEGSDFTDDFSDMTDDLEEEDMDEDADDDFDDQPATFRDPFTGPWTFSRPDFDHMRLAQQYFVPGPNVHFHTPHHHHHHHQHQSYWDALAWGHGAPSSIGSVDHTSDGEREPGSEEEDEDEDEEMDSFIDDEEIGSGTDRSTVVGDHSYTSFDFDPASELSILHNEVSHPEHASVSGESYDGSEQSRNGESDEEGEEDEDEDEGPIRAASSRRRPQPQQPQQPQRRRQQQNSVPNPYLAAALASIRDSSNRISSHRRRPHPSSSAHRRTPASGTSSTAAAAAGTSANNAINVEDDSDDDMPIPASRRRRV